jgi:hypothetical protein
MNAVAAESADAFYILIIRKVLPQVMAQLSVSSCKQNSNKP